jgi:hypothetical protein
MFWTLPPTNVSSASTSPLSFGAVAEKGSHQELLDTPGSLYRSMYLSQRGDAAGDRAGTLHEVAHE